MKGGGIKGRGGQGRTGEGKRGMRRGRDGRFTVCVKNRVPILYLHHFRFGIVIIESKTVILQKTVYYRVVLKIWQRKTTVGCQDI